MWPCIYRHGNKEHQHKNNRYFTHGYLLEKVPTAGMFANKPFWHYFLRVLTKECLGSVVLACPIPSKGVFQVMEVQEDESSVSVLHRTRGHLFLPVQGPTRAY